MLAAIARLELRFHAREFLTYIYALVFFLLAFAFASGSGIELVRDRGAVPRGAPWTIAHAVAGLTAFGQLMTAFIAATALLRDAVTRMEPLLFSTGLTRHAYVGGKLLGAMATMLAVHLAIPMGIALGASMPWAPPGAAPITAGALTWPLVVLVLPNVVLITAAFFAGGVFSRSFVAVAVTGLLLVAAWQAGLSLVVFDSTRMLGALVDPFGNAAIEAATAGWGLAERSTRPLPLAPYVTANRALWGVVAGGLIALVLTRFRLTPTPVRAGRVPRGATRPRSAPSTPRAATGPAVERRARWMGDAFAWARLTTRTILLERGFVAIALLAVLNATANLVSGSEVTAAAIADSVVVHARVFLILLATIYAGELVWRERDLRVRGLVDAVPASSSAEVAGKAAAVAVAACGIGGLLAAVTLPVLLLRGDGDAGALLAGSALLPAAMLFALAMLSLAVHAAMRSKVRAHFALIAAWVVSVALAQGGTRVRLADLVRADADDPLIRVAALLCLGGAGAALATVCWTRGSPAHARDRVAMLDRRQAMLALSLAAVCTAAAVALTFRFA